jgi:hypothetical protein
MMLELEGLIALRAFEFSQNCTLVVANHVSLEAVDVRKSFVANLTRLEQRGSVKRVA